MKRRVHLLGLLVMLLLVPAGMIVHAQSGGGYDLSWWTVDSGGGVVGGGGFTLVGTSGQPDASPALTGGGYALSGGFWQRTRGAPVWRIYLPLVVRQSP